MSRSPSARHLTVASRNHGRTARESALKLMTSRNISRASPLPSPPLRKPLRPGRRRSRWHRRRRRLHAPNLEILVLIIALAVVHVAVLAVAVAVGVGGVGIFQLGAVDGTDNVGQRDFDGSGAGADTCACVLKVPPRLADRWFHGRAQSNSCR